MPRSLLHMDIAHVSTTTQLTHTTSQRVCCLLTASAAASCSYVAWQAMAARARTALQDSCLLLELIGTHAGQ
jgi:hypothetical protein